jgi:excisionase family DNA binding protein
MKKTQPHPTRGSRQKPPESGTEPATMRLWPDAARRLGIGRMAAYEAAKHGQIPILKIGRRLLVPRAALERLVA